MVAKFKQPDYNDAGQSGTGYPLAIDATVAVLAELAAQFAVSAQDTPNLTVAMRVGRIYKADRTIVEKAAQNSATLVAPTVNPRNDIVVIDATTGTISVIAGAEAASPVDPAITANKLPKVRIRWTVAAAQITNSMLDDLRFDAPSFDAILDYLGVVALDDIVPIVRGGTGATSAGAARTALAAAGLADANIFTSTQTIQSNTAGSTSGPDFILDRQQSGGAGAGYKLGNLHWKSKKNDGTTVTYAVNLAQITDSGDSTYTGKLLWEVYKSASLQSPAMSLGGNTGGLAVGTSAAEPGDGKINAENGVYHGMLQLLANPIGAPTARAANTVFQAATDLVVIYTCVSGGGGVPAGAQGLTDAANPPTVQRSQVTSDTTYGGGGPGVSTGVLCVRKGEYWKVVNNGNSTIFEYPVGT